MRVSNRRGQSMIEYSVLVVIVLAALLTIGTYFKRGVQGHWKTAVDELGDQYDPRFASTNIIHRIDSNNQTYISVVEDSIKGGYWTKRQDFMESEESKEGFSATGEYVPSEEPEDECQQYWFDGHFVC
jgi:Flp pilus assembly pilin Flp